MTETSTISSTLNLRNSGNPPLKGLVVVGILVFILFGLYQWLFAFNPQKARVITVGGKATVQTKIEKAQIVFQYISRSQDHNLAIASGEAEFASITDQLKALGNVLVEESGAQVIPVGAGANTTYEYRKTAKATVQTPEAVKSVIDLLKIQNITIAQTIFVAENENQVKAQLLQKALEDAKQKAESLAEASKGGVGRVVSVAEIDPTPTEGNVLASDINSADQSLGQNSMIELSATVSVSYELK
jgi:uncharacterized protein YggE